MTSVLFVPCCTERVAATRLRVSQYVPLLEARGTRCTVFPAISDAATKMMLASPGFKGLRRIAYYLRIMAERLARFWVILGLARRHQIVFFQRTTFPLGLHKLLKKVNAKLIFDFDDSIYMADPEDGHPGFFRTLKNAAKRAEVSGMLRASRAAVVENQFLKAYALRYCPDVSLIPGPIDTRRFRPGPRASRRTTVIGWIGSPSTAGYLSIVAEPLALLAREHSIEVRLIGAGAYEFKGVRTLSVPWSLETEVSELQGFDIGIMPMTDNEWTRGKLGVKMLQYMAVGAVAAASRTPTNAEVIEDGVNGCLIDEPSQWAPRLSRLISDADLRERLGRQGRRTIEDRFSLDAGAPKLIGLLERL